MPRIVAGDVERFEVEPGEWYDLKRRVSVAERDRVRAAAFKARAIGGPVVAMFRDARLVAETSPALLAALAVAAGAEAAPPPARPPRPFKMRAPRPRAGEADALSWLLQRGPPTPSPMAVWAALSACNAPSAPARMWERERDRESGARIAELLWPLLPLLPSLPSLPSSLPLPSSPSSPPMPSPFLPLPPLPLLPSLSPSRSSPPLSLPLPPP